MKFGTMVTPSGTIPVMCLWEDHWLAIPDALRDALSGQTAPRLLDYLSLEDRFVDACRDLQSKGRQDTANGIVDPKFCAPIPKPPKNVFCVGRNYMDHIAEDNRSRDLHTDLPKYPQFFTKPPTAVVGPGDTIELHETVTRRLDYEVELTAVIGRRCRDVPSDEAIDQIFGFTICNDVTARDLQRRHDQWFKGKGLDTTCPLGPYIVHKDAVGDGSNLAIKLSVNGEQRQDARTSAMIFGLPELIESLSAGLTLEPGDMIATGTPSGVGYAMDPRQYLADGDVIRCEIEKIGVLENRVAAKT